MVTEDIPPPQPLLDLTGIDQLREALTSAGYTSTGIAARLGPAATAALARGDQRAALRATTGGDPLSTLIRLFLCAQSEPVDAVAEALAPLPLPAALAAGLVEQHGDNLVRQGVDLVAYGDGWWVVADVPAAARPGRPPPRHCPASSGSYGTATWPPRSPAGGSISWSATRRS